MRINKKPIFSSTLIIFELLLLLFSSKVMGRNSLDDQIFLCCETPNNITERLSKGYRAFILLQDNNIGKTLTEVNTFLSKNPKDIVVLLIKQSTPNLVNTIKNHQIVKCIAIPGEDKLNNISDCKKRDKRLFIFAQKKNTFCFSIQRHICNYTVPPEFPSNADSGFSSNRVNDFVVFRMDNTHQTWPDSLQSHNELVPELFNNYTGKLPNFFVTDNPELFFAFKNLMGQYNWYSANVLHNKKTLNNILWKEMPNMVSYGKIHTHEVLISPQKRGFRFSPDVFQFNEINSKETKTFIATPKQIYDDLVLSIQFNKDISNSVEGTTHTPYSNIKYVKDNSRGWCGLFNGKGHYVDYDTGIEFADNITISVWVNPSEINLNHSIMGKGEAFSVKFRDGKLLFTSHGIKDHFSDSLVVRKDRWQHLAFVFSAGKNVRFFHNGQFVGEESAAEFTTSNQSLLIGTNLWDEYFEGKMDDLAIWNRALSDEEVTLVYNQGLIAEKNSNLIVWLLLGLITLIIILGYYIFVIGSRGKKKPSKNADSNYKKANTTKQNDELPQLKGTKINLFGGFHFENRDGEDLTHRFSKRRKQLFITVLIATLRDNGISSKQLTNNLWPGHSAESAKNNRSTQVKRLREIFYQNSGVNIIFIDKKWKINFQNDVYCDLDRYYYLLIKLKKEENYNPKLLNQLLNIIEKGALLPQMEEEWLDGFKSKISDELIEFLLPLYQNKEFMENHKLVIRLCDALLVFDPLNETVLMHKVNTLLLLGKKTLAHECLEHFAKYYQNCYNQPFNTSFADIINLKS